MKHIKTLSILLIFILLLCSVGCAYRGEVYISEFYGKIHKRSDCSGMKYYFTMDYDDAIEAGYVKCKKCFIFN